MPGSPGKIRIDAEVYLVPRPQSKRLQEASRQYSEEMKLMEEYTRIFPYEWPIPNDWQERMKAESLGKGAGILRKLRPLEEEAIKYMREALSEWETP